MKTKIETLVCCLAVVFAATWAAAQPPEGGRPKGPPERDGRPGFRGDGPPRRGGPGDRDFRPPVPPLMRALDTDKDGKLSASEIENAPAALKELDKDGDGTLTREELRPERPRPPRGGEGRDRGPGPRDGDARDGDRPRRPGGPGQREGRPGGPPEGRGGPRSDRDGPGSAAFIDRVFENDKNDDGKLTKDEMPERGKRLFEHADANDDGSIDRAELEAAFKRMRERRGGPGAGDREREGRDGGRRPERRERPEST